MTQPWRYDETISTGTDYHCADEVRAYDRHMQKLRNTAQEAQEILDQLALTADNRLWEIGTGTAECALALAPHVKEVIATDISTAMLDYARDKAQQRHISNVRFEQGGFLSGFRPQEPVDAIVTQLALHHLPDFWKFRALQDMADRLRPGGKLYLRDVVFPSAIDDYDSFFAQTLDQLGTLADETIVRQTIDHIKREYSTLDWILEGLLTRSGLKIVNTGNQGFISTYLCEK
nr:class I SAM-dependent methyltransferase [uncultured Desulfuromonas sp.]